MWHWLSVNSAAVSCIAAMITAVVAVWTLRWAAIDNRERSEPMMLAEFRRPKHSNHGIDLVVRNAGPTPATNVEVKFDPMPVVPNDGQRYVTRYLLRRYAHLIPVIAPGQELTNLWCSSRPEPTGEGTYNHEPTSDSVIVTISYRGLRKRHVFTQTFHLEVDLIKMTTEQVASESELGRMRAIAASLQKIERSLAPMGRLAQARADEADETDELGPGEIPPDFGDGTNSSG